MNTTVYQTNQAKMRNDLLLFSTIILGIGFISSTPCHRRSKRCTMPECDIVGALSMCAEATPHCPANHDDVFDKENICHARGLKCCRSICAGPGTMCLPKENPCIEGYETVPGKCPHAVDDRYQCCKPKASAAT
ncbi:uncharacterized protein LOC135681409 isoform X2 [Rhopilema esculentum]|uniref:uncharacterized protein LOC135681409 isoform X2 n=1 Tax=Rhopilema esculentum TaxID=499914 RepID=UPI0031D63D0D